MAEGKESKEIISVAQLKENYDIAYSNYNKIFRKMIVLDAVNRSKLWQTIGATFPDYQILPDTNWVNYIVSNLVASIYTVTKSAHLLPTSEDDRELVEHINIALDYIWDTAEVGDYQTRAGSYAALFNLGVTQVGWDSKANKGKGNITLKNINPLRYMRDPFAVSLDTAGYCMTWEELHKSVIASDARYREKFQEFLTKQESVAATSAPPLERSDRANASIAKDYYQIFTHFVKHVDDKGNCKLAEIHTVNNEHIIYSNMDVKPAEFPFAELFCNLPDGDIFGTSEPAKILSNNIAYNILNSMMLTAEYKNQRPPKFISSSSGLNIRTFAKYGNEADHTFIVNGDASRAVHYHQYPAPSATAINQKAGLAADIQVTSGVDGRYTGRDTGSVITTGGVEDMLNRVTLIDTPKIKNYEKYTKDLTKLILSNYIEFSLQRTYFKKDPTTGQFTPFIVNYKNILEPEILHYSINISSELPKNKQRIAAAANMLMEKQMQYGMGNGENPDLILPEEWLQLQDLPNKEYMLKRMNIQRLSNTTAEVADTLFSYANFVNGGLAPDDAIGAVAQNMMAKKAGQKPVVEVPPAPATPQMPGLEQMFMSPQTTEMPMPEEVM